MLLLKMGYNSATVIIGMQSIFSFLTSYRQIAISLSIFIIVCLERRPKERRRGMEHKL